MDTAPILLFVYNRPAHTRQALEALSRNTLAAASDVFVYSDAARSEADCAAVEEVRHIVKEAKGFRQVHVTEREQNWGLARNIIDGVTTMVNRYGPGHRIGRRLGRGSAFPPVHERCTGYLR